MNSYSKSLLIIFLCVLFIPASILMVISILIRIKMGSPIFFKQERAGLRGEPFYIYKFRTMTNQVDEKGELLPSYQRITPFGNFIRKNSLDELPQLFNIIRGDLTFVGPRPLHVEYNALYNEQQRKRLEVTPGITGLAQVNGRNNIPWKERFKLDTYYVDNKSIWLDTKIIIKTVIKVFKKTDINPANLKETPRFKGGSNE